ncbi:MAG: YedE-related selenium metabolism membrane protein [Clostridia bacterium]|nr:YedE-related selenium metabolism membrane protein [Clostridia bacterium]
MRFIKKHGLIIASGLIVGILAVVLVACGNPKNMGFCIACFLRDIAGGVGMHRAEVVQYIRPEIIGLVLGAMIAALVSKEFSVKGGSAPLTRFVIGFAVMVGALMFLGCPLRMVLRIGGGDLNAIIGLVGFVIGILAGILTLNKGFTLKRSYDLPKAEGFIMPAISIALFVLLIAGAGVLFFSESGPGSMRAPIAVALIIGLAVGILAQRSRLCMVAGIRDSVMFKDFHLLYGFIAIIVATLIGNAITGNLKFGFDGQPVAHNDFLWNLLGMVVVGYGSVLLGGCPLRQLILAGSGNSDSGVAVIGMVVGAAFCHNFKLASSADSPTANGKIAVIICIVVLALIAVLNTRKKKA